MLRMIEPQAAVTKDEYKKRARALRSALLNLQRRIRDHDQPVIIVIAGDDRSGRHETINKLCEWMDPRFVQVNAYGPSQHQDDERPFFWRYWRDAPQAGDLAIFLRDWTSTSLVQYLNGEISENKLRRREQYIRNFEKKHTDAGALIIKCWLHISEKELQLRLKTVRDTPYFDKKDMIALQNYPYAIESIQKTLSATSTDASNWHIIDGAHPRNRNLQVGELIQTKIEAWLDKPLPALDPVQYIVDSKSLPSITMKATPKDQWLDEQKAKKELKKLQADLRSLMFDVQKKSMPIVAVFEGWDAAGKGGAIRRMVAPLDAGFYRIRPVAAPTEEEKAHHYMWRFWRDLPSNGHMTVFDRSWYGRVLVERVEGFASEAQWQNAYKEINDFEEQLIIHGSILTKFWINISKEEQLTRFKEREQTEYKRYKITDEDWRNRERWDDYVIAVEDMIARTSTKQAPWSIVSTDDKRSARIEVIKTMMSAIKEKLP